LLAPAIAAIVYHKVGTLAAQRTLPVLPSVSEFTNKREGRPSKAGFFITINKGKNMNVIIEGLNLSNKQLIELRAAIKARYTPEKVKALNARLKATEGK